jgi:hypothetical protein
MALEVVGGQQPDDEVGGRAAPRACADEALAGRPGELAVNMRAPAMRCDEQLAA